MDYANVVSNQVVNIIVADPAFIATLPGIWIDVTNMACGIGWAYVAGGFVPPAPAVPPYDAQPGRVQFVAMMGRRADKLEKDGYSIQALILRESLK